MTSTNPNHQNQLRWSSRCTGGATWVATLKKRRFFLLLVTTRAQGWMYLVNLWFPLFFCFKMIPEPFMSPSDLIYFAGRRFRRMQDPSNFNGYIPNWRVARLRTPQGSTSDSKFVFISSDASSLWVFFGHDHPFKYIYIYIFLIIWKVKDGFHPLAGH